MVCAPSIHCQPPPPACGRVILQGSDGKFLGVATSNQLATDGVCNQFSSFGSQFSQTSIFDQFSPYGSQFSQWSAYNPLTNTPPFLSCEASGGRLQWVTKNTLLANTIDPDRLCATLAAAGL
jgi:hypothetical protein